MPPSWSRPGYEFDAGASVPLRGEAYGDEGLFARERTELFAPDGGLLYLGHESLLPPVGHRRADSDPRLILTREGGVVRALANVCTHACRPLVNDDEAVCRARVGCAFHDWTFRSDGSLIGGRDMDFGPGATGEEQRSQLALRSYPLIEWHGFQFSVDDRHAPKARADLARIDADFDARGLHNWLDLDE